MTGRKQNPSKNPKVPVSTERAIRKEKPRRKSVDYKTRKMQRSARNIQRLDQSRREGSNILPHVPHEAQPSNGKDQRKFSASSSDSTSSDSAEIFLRHVRGSLEARKELAGKRASYNVFKDEIENGFLEGPI
jgi:hypothetical protein